MSIRRWHKGKLMILWAWGGGAGALLFTDFLSTGVLSTPLKHAAEFVGTLIVFLALSIVTWHWLGDRPEPSVKAAGQNEGPSEDG
jgi:hypothetical protein